MHKILLWIAGIISVILIAIFGFMIYLRQDYNIHPATPATRDRFVEFARESLLPEYERLGARLLVAWFNHA